MHAPVAVEKKGKGKVTGFHIQILDDGSYLLSVETEGMGPGKRYSYERMEDMLDDIRDDFPENTTYIEEDEDEDEPNPKKDKARSMAKKMTSTEDDDE